MLLVWYSFWLTLLTDAITLLDSNVPVFSHRDTCELIGCLEELMMEETDHPRHSSTTPLADKHHLIRLALAKNLMRATIDEASSPFPSL